jgi:hypothetical protein
VEALQIAASEGYLQATKACVTNLRKKRFPQQRA